MNSCKNTRSFFLKLPLCLALGSCGVFLSGCAATGNQPLKGTAEGGKMEREHELKIITDKENGREFTMDVGEIFKLSLV